MLPKVTDDVRPVFTSPPPSFVSNMFKGTSAPQDGSNASEVGEKTKGMGFAGYGFGTKGEKAAGLKGI